LARVTRVEAWGAGVAVGEKVGARIEAKARNAMAARREQGNSGVLAGGVEGAFMAAPINPNLLFDFKHGADLTPILRVTIGYIGGGDEKEPYGNVVLEVSVIPSSLQSVIAGVVTNERTPWTFKA
jgi:hypothetical protein